jgi:arginase
LDKHKISIIGVPLDHGQSRRGVDMGPSAIRYAGVIDRIEAIGHEVIDEGNIQIEVAKNAETQNSKLKNLNEVIKANTSLAEIVEKTVES